MKRFSFLRKVIAIAICLAGVVMFSGCNKDDGDNSSKTTTTGNFKLGNSTYTLDKAKVWWGDGKGNAGITDGQIATSAYFMFYNPKTGNVIEMHVWTDTDDAVGSFHTDAGIAGSEYMYTYEVIITAPGAWFDNTIKSKTKTLQIQRTGDEYEFNLNSTTEEGKIVEFHYKGKLKEVSEQADLYKLD